MANDSSTATLTWRTVTPDSTELDDLARQFRLHPLHIEDCRTPGERVKAEQTPGYLFVILVAVEISERQEIHFQKLSIFAGREFCVTVCDVTQPAIQKCLARATAAGPDQSPGSILYHIFDSIVDSYLAAMDRIGDNIDVLENRVLSCPDPPVLQEIFRLKGSMVQFRRVLVNTRDVSLQIHRATGSLIEESLLPFYRDIYDHVARNVDLVETMRDQLTNTLDVYLSSVANRTNEVMKVLTILSTIALPALVISGIYGMNVKSIPFADSPHALAIVLCIMGACTIALLGVLKARKWI